MTRCACGRKGKYRFTVIETRESFVLCGTCAYPRLGKRWSHEFEVSVVK